MVLKKKDKIFIIVVNMDWDLFKNIVKYVYEEWMVNVLIGMKQLLSLEDSVGCVEVVVYLMLEIQKRLFVFDVVQIYLYCMIQFMK